MQDREVFINRMADFGVCPTPEQLEKCDHFATQLGVWQKKINLIGNSTVPHIYTRHILDSVQLIPLVPRGTVIDIGSGAGIPGVILSIFLEQPITLCERIHKKSSFLKAMVRELGLSERCDVFDRDIEQESRKFDVVMARAITSINDFFGLTEHCRNDDTLTILPKGELYNQELDEARKNWSFDVDMVDSITSDSAKILLIKNIAKL